MPKERTYTVFERDGTNIASIGEVTAEPLAARTIRFSRYADRTRYQLTQYGPEAARAHFLAGDIRSLAPACSIYVPGEGWRVVASGDCRNNPIIEEFRQKVRREWRLFNTKDISPTERW